MSYYRRGYNWETQHYVTAPVNGWNPDSPIHELPATEAPALDNFIIHPGKLVARGAFQNWADLTAVTPIYLAGVHPVLSNSTIIISRKTVSSTAYVDPWFAPIVRPAAAATLGTPVTTLQIASGGTTLSTATPGAGLIPGPRGITFEGQRYYIGYGTSSAAVQDNGSVYYAQKTSLCTQTGTNTFTEFTLAPHGAIDIKAHQSRIWLLGGIDTPGAGTTFNPLTLFFTNPISTGGGNLTADWQDPVSGLTNKIVMDGDSMDPGVGLGLVRGGVVIFRYGSIWLLRGTTTANYTLVPVSKQIGCIDPRSIVETDQGCYFMSQQGLMMTNGVTVVNVSNTVLQTIQSAVSIVHNNIRNSFGGYITCATSSDGSIIVSMGIPALTAGVPNGSLQPVWCGMYTPAVKAWTRLTSALWKVDGTMSVAGNYYPGWVVNTHDKRLLTVGDTYITQMEALSSSGTSTYSSYIQTTTAVNDASNGGTVNWAPGPPWAAYLNSNSFIPTTKYLKANGFGFNIPTGATILGIQALIWRHNDASGQAVDSSVLLAKAGTLGGMDKANVALVWPNVSSLATYGSSTDLWGQAWTPSDINNAGFGFGVAATQAGGHSGYAYVDAFVAIVSYSFGGSTFASSFVQTSALYDKDAAGNFQPIPLVWRTMLMPLGYSSRKFAQLKRIWMDYAFQGAGFLAPGGWSLTATEPGDRVLGATQQVPLGGASSSGSVSGGISLPKPGIQHFNYDLANEAADMWLTVSWTDQQRASAPSGVVAEVYTVGAEYQTTRDLR